MHHWLDSTFEHTRYIWMWLLRSQVLRDLRHLTVHSLKNAPNMSRIRTATVPLDSRYCSGVGEKTRAVKRGSSVWETSFEHWDREAAGERCVSENWSWRRLMGSAWTARVSFCKDRLLLLHWGGTELGAQPSRMWVEGVFHRRGGCKIQGLRLNTVPLHDQTNIKPLSAIFLEPLWKEVGHVLEAGAETRNRLLVGSEADSWRKDGDSAGCLHVHVSMAPRSFIKGPSHHIRSLASARTDCLATGMGSLDANSAYVKCDILAILIRRLMSGWNDWVGKEQPRVRLYSQGSLPFVDTSADLGSIIFGELCTSKGEIGAPRITLCKV